MSSLIPLTAWPPFSVTHVLTGKFAWIDFILKGPLVKPHGPLGIIAKLVHSCCPCVKMSLMFNTQVHTHPHPLPSRFTVRSLFFKGKQHYTLSHPIFLESLNHA